ncbi:polyprenyl synthetase family protein [Marinobacter sp.]|uniref:polyprenyl synthetase family protein n=1 Tax=Marinobacter sp. TaxID=50741 RepID=UPI0039AF9D89
MTDTLTAPTDFLDHCRRQVEQELEHRLAIAMPEAGRLCEAMRYSVLGGGKRIRPALCLGAAMAMAVPGRRALVPACAVELVHAYSLIHDDLPAMDDDDLRRGRATTHIAYDEATAILAGDALQALAFEWLSEAPELTDPVRLRMVRELARASGYLGMVGGQAIDLASVGQQVSLATLELMHRRKTGALIEVSVRLGALAAQRLDDDRLERLHHYARALGLAFQVQDDLLDVEGDTSVIGKPRGSDVARAKPTYPALLGVTGARSHLADLLAEAHRSLADFGPEAEPLRTIADFVVARSH